MSIKRRSKLLALFLAALMCASALTSCALGNSSEAKYNKAFELTEQGDYEAAYALFTELGDYKDAKKEASKFHYIATKENAEFITAEGKEIENLVITFGENNLPEKCIKTGEGGYQHTCLFTYSESGKLVKVACSDTDGITELAEFFYDGNDRLVKEYYDYEEITTYEYTYYEDGKTATMSVTSAFGSFRYEYFYNEAGKEIKNIFTSENEGTLCHESSYDANGNLTQIITTDENGKEVSRSEYLYDEKGCLSKETFSESDSVICISEYTYDDKNQLTRESFDYGEGDVITYDYTYDANGNQAKSHIKRPDNSEDIYTTAYQFVYIPFTYTEAEWELISYGLTGW